ncbi:nitroreductase/quinone reductase family protein [Microbispora sp. NPDC049125]|uniref:nitroreductase/quinone reductase family protein n=1 Tax=Microbispora sp. NPDC049125 TaxID=3154929 RepID=UPI003464FE23
MRVVNAVVRWLLLSPLHDLLSRGVALLLITGRRTGRTIAVPVQYAEDGDVLTIVSRRERLWWRNLVGGTSVRVVLRGRVHEAYGSASPDAGAVRAALTQIGQPPARFLDDGVAVTMVVGRAEPRPAPGGLWRRWFTVVTLGELAGFAIPAVVAASVASAGSALLQALAIVAAGVAEGTILGLAQAYALRSALPWVPTTAWVRATAGGAAISWTIGAVPVVLGDRFLDLPPLGLIVLGVALLTAMGGLQWRVLAGRLPRSGWWVAATAGAWLTALGVFLAVTTPLWREGRPGWLISAIGVLGGGAMAVTVAALTGLAFTRLAASEHEDRAPVHAA